MIYAHTSYRSFLKEILADKAKKNPKYSLRAMAKHLGFASSSLSEVMAGKSGFSLQSARKVAAKLNLSSGETEYLCLLVQFESSADPEIREHIFARMKDLTPKKLPIHDLSIDHFKQISEWYHSAILEMVSLHSFEMISANVATRSRRCLSTDAEVSAKKGIRMEKLIDGILTVVYVTLIAFGGKYTLQQAVAWSQKVAFEKAAKGLGHLEPATQKITGGKLDF